MRSIWGLVLSRYYSDVCDSCAFRHRRHSANVKHDTGNWRACFKDYLTEIVCDIADSHSLLDVCATTDEWVEHSRLVAGQRHDLFDPNRMLDDGGRARQHLQIAHHIQAAIHQSVEVIGFNGAGMARLGGD